MGTLNTSWSWEYSSIADVSFLRSHPPATACSICLNDFIVAENIQRLPCDHYFHHQCILRWFSCKNNCPICRRIIWQVPVRVTAARVTSRQQPVVCFDAWVLFRRLRLRVTLWFHQLMDLIEGLSTYR
ncbi:putative transcription factor C2H2 family [Helianthus debilis subsp. tardiflorus]